MSSDRLSPDGFIDDARDSRERRRCAFEQQLVVAFDTGEDLRPLLEEIRSSEPDLSHLYLRGSILCASQEVLDDMTWFGADLPPLDKAHELLEAYLIIAQDLMYYIDAALAEERGDILSDLAGVRTELLCNAVATAARTQGAPIAATPATPRQDLEQATDMHMLLDDGRSIHKVPVQVSSNLQHKPSHTRWQDVVYINPFTIEEANASFATARLFTSPESSPRNLDLWANCGTALAADIARQAKRQRIIRPDIEIIL